MLHPKPTWSPKWVSGFYRVQSANTPLSAVLLRVNKLVFLHRPKLRDLDKTEENRELVKNFLYDVMQGNNLDKTPDYFDGDNYIQHNSGIADGVSGLNAALGAMAEQGISMVYDEVHMVLAEGNFVLAVSEGTFGGTPTSYYDLWRVENGKIAEHWDVMETIADQSTWQNENGKF